MGMKYESDAAYDSSRLWGFDRLCLSERGIQPNYLAKICFEAGADCALRPEVRGRCTAEESEKKL